jgi:hypothetical protein
MRHTPPRTVIAVLTLLAGLPMAAHASSSVDIQLYDRTSGEFLPTYSHHGRRYVAGEPGHEYEIRLRNDLGTRVLAVTSVDGVNVVTGATAAWTQAGYVIGTRGGVAIDGWRKNLGEVAAFCFTSLPDSYAARTGRPDNVGVIGIAVFRERPRADFAAADEAPVAAPEPAPSAGASRAENAASRLGTGHGARHESVVQEVEFERASDAPDAVIRLYYDSRRNLVAQGVIPPVRTPRWRPEPFPDSRAFVPDP